MSRYIRLGLAASILAVVLMVSARGSSQASIPVKQETVLTFAHDLLQVFYPELFDKNHRVSMCVTTPGDDTWTVLNGVYFTVTSAEVNPLDKLISTRPVMTDPVILAGSIWLPAREYGRVQELNAHSDAAHEQKLNDLRRLVASRPDWSEMQMVNALKAAGARYTPQDREAFVNSLPISRTERFLGSIRTTSVEFVFPNRDPNGHYGASGLNWVVQVGSELPDGTHPHYTLFFEPFEGKLTAIRQSLVR